MPNLKVMAWISFPDLMPTFFVKDSLFSLTSPVGKLIHLDMTTINKAKPSCTKSQSPSGLGCQTPYMWN